VQVGGLRGGPDAVDHQVAEPGLHGADQAGGQAGGAQAGLHQVRRRGLAGRAGDPDHREPLGGVAVDRRRQVTQDRAGIVHDQRRQPGDDRRVPAGRVGQDRDRPG
jgi:hypothetical protein